MPRARTIVFGAVAVLAAVIFFFAAAYIATRDMLVVTVRKAEVSGRQVVLELEERQYSDGGAWLQTAEVETGNVREDGGGSMTGGSIVDNLITKFVPSRGESRTVMSLQPEETVKWNVKVGDVVRLNPGDEFVFYTTTQVRETSNGPVTETIEARMRVSGP